MFSRILRRIPFIHHQPPLNMPLRKAIIWSLQRPVNLKQIEVNLLGHLRKNEQIALDELKSSIAYLRKKRFYKRDSSNLFVAGVRAACEHDAALGIEFGKSMIGEIPDIRAIRTLDRCPAPSRPTAPSCGARSCRRVGATSGGPRAARPSPAGRATGRRPPGGWQAGRPRP